MAVDDREFAAIVDLMQAASASALESLITLAATWFGRNSPEIDRQPNTTQFQERFLGRQGDADKEMPARGSPRIGGTIYSATPVAGLALRLQ